MADERLRDLERRASAGDVDAEVRLLRERLRSRRLGRTWLELGALLGHPPACRALDEPLRVVLPTLSGRAAWEAWLEQAHTSPRTRRALLRLDESFFRWLGEFDQWGRDGAWARMALVAARLVVPHTVAGNREFLEARLAAIERCVDSPEPPEAGELRRLLADLRWSTQPLIGRVVYGAVEAIARVHSAHQVVRGATRVLADAMGSEQVAALQVRVALREALLPWALSRDEDPEGFDLELLELRRRWRSGRLALRRLEVAAFLGDAKARSSLRLLDYARYRPPATGAELDLLEWARELHGWGSKVALRAAVVAAREALPVWEESVPGDPRPRVALDAAAAGLKRATKQARVAARAAVEPLEWEGDPRAAWAAEAGMHAAMAAAEPGTPLAREAAVRAVLRAADAVGDARIREVVTAALLRWALG